MNEIKIIFINYIVEETIKRNQITFPECYTLGYINICHCTHLSIVSHKMLISLKLHFYKQLYLLKITLRFRQIGSKHIVLMHGQTQISLKPACFRGQLQDMACYICYVVDNPQSTGVCNSHCQGVSTKCTKPCSPIKKQMIQRQHLVCREGNGQGNTEFILAEVLNK